MPKIKPFDGFLIKAERAGAVVSPAYDAVSSEQRRSFATENPDNFINTMRLQEDFPEDAQPTQSELLAANKASLTALLEDGSFEPFPQPSMFIYELGSGNHTQTGLVCEVAVTEYENGTLRKHESTRSDKEDLLARYQEAVGASSSPICLTYPQQLDIDNLIKELTTAKSADLDFTTRSGDTQKIWAITDADSQNKLLTLFEPLDAIYLTDGHHRAASGCRYAEIMREKTNSNTGDEPFNQLLVALFPDNQLNLLPFHRCIKTDNGISVDDIIKQLEQNFIVEKQKPSETFEPTQHGEFGMLIDSAWYSLSLKTSLQGDPIASLDVSVLQDHILDPVLDIKDMRNDPRLGYVAGISGQAGIEAAVAEGWNIIFTCYPTSIRQLMNVADANGLMPPKSTYFDPKPRSGIFVRLK